MKQLIPIYGINYNTGFEGFSIKTDSILSKGISWFTRKETNKFTPSHCFYVLNEYEGIEADWNGIVRFPLSKYFAENYICVFRKPNNYTEVKTQINSDFHLSCVGQRYDYRLLFGHFLYQLTRIKKFKIWLDNKAIYICSELGATGILKAYGKVGLLRFKKPNQINPNELFLDAGRSKIFEDYKYNLESYNKLQRKLQ